MLPIIQLTSLSAGYDGRTVLHDVDLNVYPLDFLGIIGPNGGGKTTLVKCILGLLKPAGGQIAFRTTRYKLEDQMSEGELKTYATSRQSLDQGDDVGTKMQEDSQSANQIPTKVPTEVPTKSSTKASPKVPTLLPDADKLHLSAHDLPEPRPAATISMGYLPQYSSIDRKFPITVEEVVLSGLSSQKPLHGRFTSQQREKARAMVVRMGLEGLEGRPIGALSGGQLQRALLGRAVVSDPEVLILDEPSTYIDQRFEARLYQLLAEINKRCAIILVSHDIGTTLQQVKSVACVNHTLDYHPSTEYVTGEWLERHFNCPIELLGHGALPHRILGHHRHG